MIEAGKCFCYRCGNVFSEAYYKNPTRTVGALLMRPKGGRNPRHFVARAYRPDGAAIAEDQQVTLESVEHSVEGLPNSITVRTATGDLLPMIRSCPGCKGNTAMYRNAGKYPTFVVAMVGARTVGKSSWLRAIATAENYARVNSLPYPYKLVFRKSRDVVDIGEATNNDSEGDSNVVMVVEKKTERVIASVVLLDASGELYQSFDSLDNRLRRIILSHGEYPGMDACLFFDSAEFRVQELENVEDLKKMDTTLQVFNQLVSEVPSSVPVGYVCTHTDKLLGKKKLIPRVEDSACRERIALLSSGTFCGRTDYGPEALLPRILQQDLIARTPMPAVLSTASRQTRRGFMIQSCANATDRNGKAYDDYRKSFNVMDPLLWILNALKLFPLEYK